MSAEAPVVLDSLDSALRLLAPLFAARMRKEDVNPRDIAHAFTIAYTLFNAADEPEQVQGAYSLLEGVTIMQMLAVKAMYVTADSTDETYRRRFETLAKQYRKMGRKLRGEPVGDDNEPI